jgi:chemotaxis protein CheX
LNGEMGTEAVKDFEKELEALTTEKPLHIIVNCQDLSAIAPVWIRSLTQMARRLKTYNKEVRYIFMNAGLTKTLKAQGVENSFAEASSLRAALVEFGLASAKTLDINFINPFLAATMTVLSTQTQTQSKPGTSHKKEINEKFTGDISGVIGLISESFSGSVLISFPGPTVLKIMSRMLGEEFHEINKQIEDGAGELTNTIFGQAKVALNEKGYGIRTGIPSVVSGKDHSVHNVTPGARIAIPFETDVGPFLIEICLSE